MKVAFYSTKEYEKFYINLLNKNQHEFLFISDNLSLQTVSLAKDCIAVCCFVIDDLSENVITELGKLNVKLIALRSAGYDHVDLIAAKKYRIDVVRVPNYSPEAVAEFTVALILTLNRKILTAYEHGLKFNFELEDLMGFNLYQKTVGIIGTGNIGNAFAKIMHGFGCRLLAFDPVPNEICQQLGVNYVALNDLLNSSDIISLHCPLNETTHYLLDHAQFAQMKKGVMLINTGRGALINTAALITALETGQVRYAGLDVYEKEKGLFFKKHQKIDDTEFLKLQHLPNVLITPHQAFLTQEAVANIVKTTIKNLTAFEQGKIINKIN